ncbi:MAG: hypothetical protein PF436_05460 [Prolixibacteraceae bacterium]|jgi:hypothetical protein|nr:hypothetical protein [Prolixibacteraceae bacterium]
MKTIKEKKLEVALLKEKLERISGKKITFEEKENILVPRNLDNRDEKHKQKIYKLLQQKVYNGDLDLSNLPFELEDLGNLEKVNGYLDLDDTPIKSLGNLEKVTGSLWLENTLIKSLGNLKEVNGNLDLSNIFITDLGNLKEVGGKIYISKNQEGKIKGLEKFDYRVW